jgi:hypothetical protein
MGARVYIPALGRFLQVDPVERGVDNDYVWPTGPIGKADVSGQAEEWRGWLEGLVIVAGVAGAIACAASVVCGVAGAIAKGCARWWLLRANWSDTRRVDSPPSPDTPCSKSEILNISA